MVTVGTSSAARPPRGPGEGGADPLVVPGVHVVRAGNPGPMTLEGTNTWLVDGPDGVLVVDPGPALPEHHAAVLTALAGRHVAVVLLTHRHADHAEGAPALAASLGAPLRARDPDLCQPGVPPLRDGEQVGRLRVLATPGHTSDSTCLVLTGVPGGAPTAVLTGDTILGRGTTVVAHPDGRLADYLASLRALRNLAEESDCPVLPGHGPALPSLRAVTRDYLDHREARLAQVRAAVAAGLTTPRAVVERVYRDVPREVWPAAEASVAAQLLLLGLPPAPAPDPPAPGPGAPDPSAGRGAAPAARDGETA